MNFNGICLIFHYSDRFLNTRPKTIRQWTKCQNQSQNREHQNDRELVAAAKLDARKVNVVAVKIRMHAPMRATAWIIRIVQTCSVKMAPKD